MAIITEVMADIPGTLHQRPWVNFEVNRNQALELARAENTDYLMFIDADETLEVADPGIFNDLNGMSYSFAANFNTMIYDRCSLVSVKLPWKWVGVLHEYLDSGLPKIEQPRLPGVVIRVRPDGARSQDPNKFIKDAALLEEALADNPDNARYVFYLAQSYKDAGKLENAITYYTQRIAMGGWVEEVWYSKYQIALLSSLLKKNHDRVVGMFLEAYNYRPPRAESLVSLARYLRGLQKWPLAYMMARQAMELDMTTDRLFIDVGAHTWQSVDETAIAASYLGRKAEAKQLWETLLSSTPNFCPPEQHERLKANLSFVI